MNLKPVKVADVRSELYVALGNCFVTVMAYDPKNPNVAAAKDGAWLLLQFGQRSKLINTKELKELLDCLKDNGTGYAVVFEKHDEGDAAAEALVAAVTAGGGKIVSEKVDDS